MKLGPILNAILIGILGYLIITRWILPAEINNESISEKYVTQIERLNDCTNLNESCSAWECLCDVGGGTDYCETYYRACVKEVCLSIIKQYNGITFMEYDFEKQDGSCLFVYPYTVLMKNIKINQLTQEDMVCLAEWRFNKNQTSEYISNVELYNDHKWFGDDGNIIEECR